MRIAFTILGYLFALAPAFATDSTALSEARRKQLAETSFYCPVGRDPMQDSSDAWNIHPIPGCNFNGPLDTKINRFKLEAPVLNPLLSMGDLKAGLQKLGVAIEGESSVSFHFRLNGGQSFSVSLIAPKEMQDPLFHFNVIPKAWGTQFLSIQAAQAGDIPALIALARTLPGNPFFWNNPHFAEEVKVLPHLVGNHSYTPLPLLSKCENGKEWRAFDGRRALLIVGDLHNASEANFFRTVLESRNFAWVALEMKQDLQPALAAFLQAGSASAEDQALDALTLHYPKEVVEPTRTNLRILKAKNSKIILLDTTSAYTNFPFTNVAFHGLVISTRNSVWAARLPEDWNGTGLMLGGLDHFIETPGSDFQDFVLDGFSGATFGLISPYDSCK
ncbi:MAG: hypothetical protein ACXWQO_17355 [Bdellovibrionota bacterium]